jgi:uncharacterized protein
VKPKIAIGLAVIAAIAVTVFPLPGMIAAKILSPPRLAPMLPPPAGCVAREFTGAAGTLAGWQCRTTIASRRGTLVHLHGVGDNRDSAAAVIERVLPLGYDVIAFDSRAHGASDGDYCTYGFHEKDDVRRVIAQAGARDVVLFGHSLGAGVALQAAAIEPAVRGVIAVSTFSDLRTSATERDDLRRLPSWLIAWGIRQVEREGRFVVDDTSPLRAAAAIDVPVLLVHGADDRHPSPAHAERVRAALGGPAQLIVVPGAGHYDVLRPPVWAQIEAWLRQGGTLGG